MPNRMIRDDLLKSERYWSCSPEARNLFLSICLSADDTARCQGSSWYLRTHCMAGTVDTAERIEKLLNELVDVDLARVYQECQARFIFVPRFKQRLRYINSKYPSPPNEINDLIINKTDSSQPKDRPKTDPSLLEVKRSEVKRSKTLLSEFSDGSAGFPDFWAAYPRKQAKKKALQAWCKLTPDASVQTDIAKGLMAAIKSDQWRKDGGQFIPHAATWLNGKRWQDVQAVETQPANRMGKFVI